MQPRLGRVDPFAEAQHDALLVGLDIVDRGRGPAERRRARRAAAGRGGRSAAGAPGRPRLSRTIAPNPSKSRLRRVVVRRRAIRSWAVLDRGGSRSAGRGRRRAASAAAGRRRPGPPCAGVNPGQRPEFSSSIMRARARSFSVSLLAGRRRRECRARAACAPGSRSPRRRRCRRSARSSANPSIHRGCRARD